MAFTVVQGGRAIDPEFEDRAPDGGLARSVRGSPHGVSYEAMQEAGVFSPGQGGEVDAQGDDPEPERYEDACALNQRLKAMLAEAEVVAAQTSRRGRPNQPRRAPRMPGQVPQGYPASPAAPLPAHESSQGINRRRLEDKVRQENMGIATRLAGSKSCILPPLSQRPGQHQESSVSINRRKFDEKVQRENASLVARIERPSRASSCGPPRKVGDPELPKGWTRGIGGRAMPPPKLRWGSGRKYDAGDWAS